LIKFSCIIIIRQRYFHNYYLIYSYIYEVEFFLLVWVYSSWTYISKYTVKFSVLHFPFLLHVSSMGQWTPFFLTKLYADIQFIRINHYACILTSKIALSQRFEHPFFVICGWLVVVLQFNYFSPGVLRIELEAIWFPANHS